MTEPKVADLCNGTLLLLVSGRLWKDQYVVNLDVCMDDTSLVQIAETLEDILSPDCQLVLLDRLILAKNTPSEIIRPISSVLHVQLKVLVSLAVMVSSDYIRVLQLNVNEALSPGKLNGQLRAGNLFLICRFQYDIFASLLALRQIDKSGLLHADQIAWTNGLIELFQLG